MTEKDEVEVKTTKTAKTKTAENSTVESVVKDLIKADSQKVNEHQLGNGAQSRGSRSHSRADESRLADGGIKDPIAAKFRSQSRADSENAAPGFLVLAFHMGQCGTTRYIFPKKDYGGIPAHFQPHGLVDCFSKGYRTFSHGYFSFLLLWVVDINIRENLFVVRPGTLLGKLYRLVNDRRHLGINLSNLRLR